MTDAAKEKKSKGAMFAVIGVIVIVAIGALVYLTGNLDKKSSGKQSAVQTASASDTSSQPPAESTATAANPQPEQPAFEIKPGNPVVAVVNGKQIMRSDVFAFIAGLPQNVRQMPINQLFDLSVEQLVSAHIVEKKADQANLANDEEVLKQVEIAKDQIIRSVYLQKEVEKRVTEDKIKELYAAYAQQVGQIEETKASHILVDTEEKAKELIAQAKSGTDFTELAKANSTGPSAERGGDLGWFAKGEMVPEFSEVAFSLKPGQVASEPVQTQFGWHVVKVEGRRNREAPKIEEVRPMLESQLRRQILDGLVDEWRDQADVAVFGINGKEDAAAASPEVAPEEAPASRE